MPLRNWLGLLIICAMISVPIFAHLEDFPIMIYDEGRLANHAIEMYESGNPLVISYDYQPEMWSTKPPLLIWMQTLSLKLFGIRDLSFRLPTAIAAVLTCIFIYHFCRRKLKAPWLGIIAVLILISTPGYVRIHGTRTGDYDVMLVLFTTISLLSFYTFIHTDVKKYFWISISALILGCLTKGVAGMLFLPAMLLYSIYQRKLGAMLRSKELYLGILAFIIFVPGYYLLREVYNPGYISAVLENDISGRYQEVKDNNTGPFSAYFSNLYVYAFKPFMIFLALGIIALFLPKARTFRSISIYLLLCSLTQVLIISGAATKHSWYAMPVLPLLAIVSAMPVYMICEQLYEQGLPKQYLRYNFLPYIFVALVLWKPFVDSVNYALETKGDQGWMEGAQDMSRVFQKMLREGYVYDHRMKAIFADTQTPVKWYMKAARLKKLPLTQLKDTSELLKDDLLILYEDSVRNDIERHFETHIVDQHGRATIYQIHGRK